MSMRCSGSSLVGFLSGLQNWPKTRMEQQAEAVMESMEQAGAKATREDVAAIVGEVYDDWIAGNGAQKVTCSFDINTGPCCDFAEDVAMLVLERFPGSEVEVEDYEDHLQLDGLTAQGIHYYVRADGWYFDASIPEGVPSPDMLPTCHSIRICASPIDGDEDEDEELTSSPGI